MSRLNTLINDFKNEIFNLLGAMKVQCLTTIGEYEQTECAQLQHEFSEERKLLIASFRKHFTEYDLSEAAIFDRFNMEVRMAVAEMKSMYGVSRPTFITQVCQLLQF
jgi:hypothetical protein